MVGVSKLNSNVIDKSIYILYTHTYAHTHALKYVQRTL